MGVWGLTYPGYGLHYPIRHGQIENWVGSKDNCEEQWLTRAGSHGTFLVQLHLQVPPR